MVSDDDNAFKTAREWMILSKRAERFQANQKDTICLFKRTVSAVVTSTSFSSLQT